MDPFGSSMKFRITSADELPALNASVARATNSTLTCLRSRRENMFGPPSEMRITGAPTKLVHAAVRTEAYIADRMRAGDWQKAYLVPISEVLPIQKIG